MLCAFAALERWNPQAFVPLGDEEHFLLFAPYYIVRVALEPAAASAGRFVSFEWDGRGMAGLESDRFLVYDEADAMTLPDSEPRRRWQHDIGPLCDERAPVTSPECGECCVDFHHLLGHFYQVTFQYF